MSANQKALLLRLRSLVADKEWTIACANMDLARAGEWSCDHKHQMKLTQADIDETLCQLQDAIRPEWTPVDGLMDDVLGSVFDLPKPCFTATVDEKKGSVVSIEEPDGLEALRKRLVSDADRADPADSMDSWLQTR